MSFTPIVLTIAGSDSSGGAGIQADIKTISATGSYACSVMTAVTSQNTLGVQAIHPIPVTHIASQLDAVFTDLSIASVKIGLLPNVGVIDIVTQKLREYAPPNIVIDPVMVATSGDILLEHTAMATLKEKLFPLASLLTPNIHEALVMLNQSVTSPPPSPTYLIEQLGKYHGSNILLKGGHLTDTTFATDYLILSNQIYRYQSRKIVTHNTHGTGCTLSSAIASYLAQGQDLSHAVALAKQYLFQAIAHADELNVGQGFGPVHHFYQLQKPDRIPAHVQITVSPTSPPLYFS